MYHFFGGCALSQFFLSETLIIGVILTMASLLNSVGRGLLPPVALFAYNTYLLYGALTNNPDVACNALAATANASACVGGRAIAGGAAGLV
jgi:hypothetical protein